MKKTFKIKRVLISLWIIFATLVLLFWLLIGYLQFVYPIISKNLTLEKCEKLSNEDVNKLNIFFKDSTYNWNIDYWCWIRSIYSPENSLLDTRLPKEIWNLKNLTYLSLTKNNLSWIIPKEYGRLSNLESLFLQDNSLNWPIPKELGSLNKLILLNLSKNNLTWKIPSELWNVNKLDFMNLSNNKLEWNIPEHIRKMKNFELFLFDNKN